MTLISAYYDHCHKHYTNNTATLRCCKKEADVLYLARLT